MSAQTGIQTSLEIFINAVQSIWGPLSSEMVAGCHRYMEQIARTADAEPWVAALHRDRPESRELHRSQAHGYLLLAHAEQAGLYRPPHDHGRSWGIYAVQQGEIEMATYLRVHAADGRVRLVRRDVTRLGPGQAKVFLPGDIHDTRCLSEPALLLRFTERDLKAADQDGPPMRRYVERDGVWTDAA